jgi:hypothetical protein
MCGKSILLPLLFSIASTMNAQKAKNTNVIEKNTINVPMLPKYWEFDTATAEFTTYKNTNVVKGKTPYGFQIFLKNYLIENGSIEFDVELSGMGFPGINFRMSENRKDGENFYIRAFGPVLPETRTTLQYAALIDGMSIWDLSDEYQAGATIFQNKWNHIKLVLSGKQMKAYVNDMTKPALEVPWLESWRHSGGISLSGNVVYTNFKFTPNETESLSPEAGYIPTLNDTRYIRKWMVSPPKEFAFGRDVIMPLPSMYGRLIASDLPDSSVQWSPIIAEPRGIINLSRIYGAKEDDVRRLAWLKTSIHSNKAQEKLLNIGFSDEIWLFVNGQIIHVGKNYFGTPSQQSEGRCTIENCELKLPLKEGDNEILIGLANYFYGWGFIARLADTDGIKIKM